MKEEVEKALTVLKQGGLILYPTDTLWGIGCDAARPEAVERVFALKQRTDSKSLIILVNKIDDLGRYMHEVPALAPSLIEMSTTPLTIVYPQAINLAPNLIAEDGSIAIRVVQHEFCSQLIYRLKRPLVSTSANISGLPAPVSFNDIADEIKKGVDYIVPKMYEGNPTKKPSSIIKLGVSGEVAVIRA